MASSWGTSFRSTEDGEDDRPVNLVHCSTIVGLSRITSLEWTQFHYRVFLDYFDLPFLRSNIRPITLQIDIENKEAAIPETGDDLISWTYTFDLARYVEAIVVLPKWSIEFFCHSDTCSFKQVTKLAEYVRSVSKLRLRDSLGSFSYGLHRQYPFPCPGTQAKPLVVNILILQAGHQWLHLAISRQDSIHSLSKMQRPT